MYRYVMILVWCFTAILILSGCAVKGSKYSELRTSIAPVQADMGRIYFYRLAEAVGSPFQPSVLLNGEEVGNSTPGGFFYVDRPPGTCEVYLSNEKEKIVKFTLDKGQSRYIRMSVALSTITYRVYPELVVQDFAESEMQSLHNLK
jgi:hypothetical protein